MFRSRLSSPSRAVSHPGRSEGLIWQNGSTLAVKPYRGAGGAGALVRTGSTDTQLENAAKIIDLSPNLPEEKKKSTISAAMISESVRRACEARRAPMLPARADHCSTHLDRAIILGHPVQQVPLLESQLPIRTSCPHFGLGQAC